MTSPCILGFWSMCWVPRGSIQRASTRRVPDSGCKTYGLASRVTQHPFYHILCFKEASALTFREKGLYKSITWFVVGMDKVEKRKYLSGGASCFLCTFKQHSRTTRGNRPVSSSYGIPGQYFCCLWNWWSRLLPLLLESLPVFHSLLISDSRSLLLAPFL